MKHIIDAMMIDINASMKIMFSTNCKKLIIILTKFYDAEVLYLKKWLEIQYIMT